MYPVTVQNYNVCYYDLETTGLNPPDHQGVEIISIAATTNQGRFNQRIMPDFEVFMQPSGPIGNVQL